jgi:hypothetical protein
MTTQYTTILKLALPVQGELSGTWGDVVNDNITQMVEQAVAGKAVVNTWTGNSHTLTTADGTTSESRCAILELTDSGTALTGAGTVVCPTNTKLYIVDNNTAQIITVKTSGGTGVAVPVGKTMLVYCDGTNVVEGVTHANSMSLGTSTVTADKILDEDNMASNSATAIATQQSIKAYVDSQVGTADTLAEVLALGNTTGGTDLAVSTGDDITFADSSKVIFGAGSDLQIYSDGTTGQVTGNVDLTGTLVVNGSTAVTVSKGTTAQRPTGVAGMFRYNTTDSQFEGYTTEWGEIGGGAAYLLLNTFTGDGSDVTFTLSGAAAENNTLAYVDGVYQNKSTYAVSTATPAVVTFSEAPANGAAIEIMVATISVTIVDGAVTTAKIADDAVTAAKIASDAVVTASITDDAVTAAKIASEPITVGITSVVTATSITATVNTHVYVSAATQTITLPASPTIGQRVLITVGNFADTVVGRNGSNIMSSATDFTMDAAYLSIQFIFTDATQGWVMS